MKKKFIFFIFISVVFNLSIFAVQEGKRGPTAVVEEENNPQFIELFSIQLENKEEGAITIISNQTFLNSSQYSVGSEQFQIPNYQSSDSNHHLKIGRVIVPANRVNQEGYTASGSAGVCEVAATAVNAIHIKTNQNGNKGVIFSLLPAEFLEKPKDYKSYYSKSSSIITDIKAGTQIFGGKYSPLVGNKVYYKMASDSSEFIPIPKGYVPQIGNVIKISVSVPAKYPSEIIFENRFGGFVTEIFTNGKQKVIAQVLKPVAGVGRFDGSKFVGVGRIRANHTGVICISTSPYGEIGGFQIIPENHAMSPEMQNARLLTQWLVIGPLSAFDPSLEGVAPLFKYFIRPVYFPLTKDTSVEEILNRFIVQVKIRYGEWQRMPTVVGRDDDALKDVTHIRILFPIEFK